MDDAMSGARTNPAPPSLSLDAEPSTMGLLVSGGLDSAILLSQLLNHGWLVRPFYVRTGCNWQRQELRAVEGLLNALRHPHLSQLIEFDMPVGDLYADHWSITGRAVPDRHTGDEAAVLPGRNPLLLLVPALCCVMNGVSILALATLAANPFDAPNPASLPGFYSRIT